MWKFYDKASYSLTWSLSFFSLLITLYFTVLQYYLHIKNGFFTMLKYLPMLGCFQTAWGGKKQVNYEWGEGTVM